MAYNPLPAIRHWMERNNIKTEKEVYEWLGMTRSMWQRRKTERNFTGKDFARLNQLSPFTEAERKELTSC